MVDAVRFCRPETMLILVMTTAATYPYPCPDCGATISAPDQRYKTYRRCRPCGLASGRDKQERVRLRKQGHCIPLQKPGPPTTTYPFPCKRCQTSVNSKAERGGNWHLCKPCHKVAMRESKVRKLYGISASEYGALLDLCEGACSICRVGLEPGGLVVDHCHVSGKVRAILCFPCNWALGHFRDSPELMRAAADYIERHAEPQPART